MVTITPLPNCCFNSSAPCNAAPDELPTSNPSFLAIFFTFSKACLSLIVKIPSTKVF